MPLTANAEKFVAPDARVAIRVGEHETYDRIVFDWPYKVKYAVKRDGASLRIVFEASAVIRPSSAIAALKRIRDFAVHDKEGDATEVSFRIAPSAKIKDFKNERSIVVDIEGQAIPQQDVKTESAPPPLSAQTQSDKAETTEQKAPSLSVVPQPTIAPPIPAPPTQASNTNSSSTPPTASDNAPPPSSADGKASQPQVPSAAPTATVTQEVVPIAKSPAQPSTQSLWPFPVPAVSGPSANYAPTPLNNYPPAPQIAIGSAPVLVAALDPHVPTRAAVWQRAGFVYIVFDKLLSLDVAALTSGQQATRVMIEPLAGMTKYTGFRFRMPYDALAQAQRDGTVWKIYVTRKKPDVPVSTALVAQPDFALGARMILPLPDAPDSIRMTDPIVGDDLFVVPLDRAEIFGVKRSLADLEILPAAQGLVVKPLNEKLIVRNVTDGIEITAEGGLNLSSAADTGTAQRSADRTRMVAAGKSMFDFAIWYGKPKETFTKTRQRLQQTIVDVSETERNRARLELARFYFAHGNGQEALAILNWLSKQMPDLKAHADFVALSGASKILANKAEEGLKELDSPLFENQPEMALWQAVALAELRDWIGAEERFAIVQPMLMSYPEPFYSRFYTLAIESALAADKNREAADWLEQLLSESTQENRNQAAIDYLRGILHVRARHYNLAEKLWKKVVASQDRLYKVRAELALIDLHIANKTLSPAKAAERLEALRFAWRGDDLEIDILHRLEQYYLQAGNIKMALSMLNRVQQLFPDSVFIPKMQEDMALIFRDIFLGDLGKKISPLEALTYYQQYRALMPTGEKGIAVMRILAERLVAVDLLEQAGDILEELARNKLQGDEKIKVTTRLTAIRLLDQKPDKALAALSLIPDNAGTAESRFERLLLRAKALSELHQYDEALALLQGQASVQAKTLGAEVAMKGQKWPEAAKYLLQLAGPPPAKGTTLTRDQANHLVNAAISLALAGDISTIDQIAIDYGPSMDKTPQGDTFRVLTQPDKLGQIQDLADVQSRLSDLDMFQGFLNTYRTSALVQTGVATESSQGKPPTTSPHSITPPSLAPQQAEPTAEQTTVKPANVVK